jgi:hypothetical protein
MFTTSKIALIAALLTAIAAPAFAGDQDTATELRDSGRYVPQMNEPARAGTVFSGVYASAVHPANVHIQSAQNDFQLQGR